MRFVDDGGAISLPPVSIPTLLDAANLWLSHLRPSRREARICRACLEKSIIN